MKEKKLYTCEICHTDYAEKSDAIGCEKNHKLLGKAVVVGEYKSMGSVINGIPIKIKVKFPDIDSWFVYKY